MKLAILALGLSAALMDEAEAQASAGGTAAPAVVEDETPTAPLVDEIKEAAQRGEPKVVYVPKYDDKIPVQLRDSAHLAELESMHGKLEVS